MNQFTITELLLEIEQSQSKSMGLNLPDSINDLINRYKDCFRDATGNKPPTKHDLVIKLMVVGADYFLEETEKLEQMAQQRKEILLNSIK